MRLQALPFAITVLLALGGCSEADRNQAMERFGAGAFEEADGTSRSTASELYSSLHGVEAVERLAPSAFEEVRAGAGHRLLVLDVSVHNRSDEPRVFSEGSLVAVSGGSERALARPVDMLSDGFLSLQVLEPSARVRGKIVFEVPRQLEGKVYWMPGQGGAHIPLDAPRAETTVARAGQSRPGSNVVAPADQPSQAVAAVDDAAEAKDGPRTEGTDSMLRPSDSASSLGTVAPAKTAGTVWSGAGRWPLSEGPAFDCASAWRRVEHIICSDQTLARMDWELNRAYVIAKGSVGDREALQRQEDAWRRHVRDECTTARCIAVVYERRIGELYSMARK